MITGRSSIAGDGPEQGDSVAKVTGPRFDAVSFLADYGTANETVDLVKSSDPTTSPRTSV